MKPSTLSVIRSSKAWGFWLVYHGYYGLSSITLMKRAERCRGLLVIVYGTQDIFLETQLAAGAAWTVITVVSPAAIAVVFDMIDAAVFWVTIFHIPLIPFFLREYASEAFPEFESVLSMAAFFSSRWHFLIALCWVMFSWHGWSLALGSVGCHEGLCLLIL